MLALISAIRKKGIRAHLLSFTSNKNSTLALASDVTCVLPETEYAAVNKMPLLSTTVQTIVSDALILSLSDKMGFANEEFKPNHPGGHLGNYEFATVKEKMISLDEMPSLPSASSIDQVVEKMIACGKGIVVLLSDNGGLSGVITDADLLRRFFVNKESAAGNALEIASLNPVTCGPDDSFVDTCELMREKRITKTVVLSDDGLVIGMIEIF